MRSETIAIGVVGCGYWGPNHIRNFLALRNRGAEMSMAADRQAERRKHVAEIHPSVRVVEDADTVISHPDIDAVVIATPVASHYRLTRSALLAGKHVLVEKPFVTEIAEAEELVALAEQRDLVLMVGHTFEYAAAVNRIRNLIEDGVLGEILYVRSLRVNLGILQHDVGVLWDLAPHDLSILRYVLQRTPTAVSAVGTAHYSRSLADVTWVNVEFGPRLMANIVCSWLDPRKVREMTIVGSEKMLVYDDVSANEKIRIFDRGVDAPRHYDSFGEFQYSYRYGDIVTPYIEEYEPLHEECAHFLECIKTGNQPRSSGRDGLSMVKVLTAAERSLRLGGARVELQGLDEPRRQFDSESNRNEGPVERKRGNVLVISADNALLGMVSRALDAFEPGYDVVTASNPSAAMNWMESTPPEVVILDQELTSSNGGSNDGWLKAIGSLPVLLVGSESHQFLGATVLSKPVQLPSLLSAIRQVAP